MRRLQLFFFHESVLFKRPFSLFVQEISPFLFSSLVKNFEGCVSSMALFIDVYVIFCCAFHEAYGGKSSPEAHSLCFFFFAPIETKVSAYKRDFVQ